MVQYVNLRKKGQIPTTGFEIRSSDGFELLVVLLLLAVWRGNFGHVSRMEFDYFSRSRSTNKEHSKEHAMVFAVVAKDICRP